MPRHYEVFPSDNVTFSSSVAGKTLQFQNSILKIKRARNAFCLLVIDLAYSLSKLNFRRYPFSDTIEFLFNSIFFLFAIKIVKKLICHKRKLI